MTMDKPSYEELQAKIEALEIEVLRLKLELCQSELSAYSQTATFAAMRAQELQKELPVLQAAYKKVAKEMNGLPVIDGKGPPV